MEGNLAMTLVCQIKDEIALRMITSFEREQIAVLNVAQLDKKSMHYVQGRHRPLQCHMHSGGHTF